MLTVTLPVFNAMPYLPAAVKSILGQTYNDFEFLIIDDGSSDGSADYLRSLPDPRIKLLVREHRGLGATLNELFSNSRTDYIARMDADDVCEPHRLERQMAYLRDRGEVVMLGTGIDFVVGSRIIDGLLPFTEHADIRQWLLKGRPVVNHPTIVVKRNAWAGVGGYRIRRSGEDLDFYLRICDFGRVANIPEALLHYRLHKKSLSVKNAAEIYREYSFAVACAKAREVGMPEPDLESFKAAWLRRSMYERAAETIVTTGQYLYRISIIHRAEGRSLLSRVYLLGAATCLPRIALSRLASRAG